MNELDKDTLKLVRAKIVELETPKKNKDSNPINTTFRIKGIKGVDLRNLALQCSFDGPVEIMNGGDEILKHIIQRIHIKSVDSVEPVEFSFEKPDYLSES